MAHQDSMFLDSSHDPPAVKLVRYNSLTDNSNYQSNIGATISWQADQKGSMSSEGVSTNPDEGQYNDEAFVAVKLRDEDKTSDSFRIVWRKLTFEVDQKSYDQIISRALSSIWPSNGKSNQKIDTRHDNSSDKRIVFENLNGHANSGEITAILGPSGAGKTSLLNAICGHTKNYRGSVRLIGGGQRNLCVSLIPQKDYLEETLTVSETLFYASKILNPGRDFDHRGNISSIVKMLNLSNCFESRASNISGGEYKRVSIAQELLRKPDVLILDEPTSGLDSLNCKNLVQSLIELIEAGREGRIKPIAIIMTIHQPDVDIFRMFHHVYCMAPGGRVIFDGHPNDVLPAVRNHSGLTEAQIPSLTVENGGSILGINPANLLIEIASEYIYGEAPIRALAEHQRTQLKQNHDDLAPVRLDSKEKSEAEKMDFDKRLATKANHGGQFWSHTAILTRRSFLSTIRDPMTMLVSFFFHLMVPFGMWLVYTQDIGSTFACPILQRELDLVSIISDRTAERFQQLLFDVKTTFESSSMYFLTTYSLSMCALGLSALTFPLHMHILLKEFRNGWYKLSSYVLAKTLVTIPFEVMFPTMTMTLIYLVLNMPHSFLMWRLWGISLVMALVAMTATAHGLIFGALFMDNMQASIVLALASTLPLVLLGGHTSRISLMHWILQKASYLSIYRYASDLIGMIRNEFGACPCDETTERYLRETKPELIGLPSQLSNMLNYLVTVEEPTELAVESNETLAYNSIDDSSIFGNITGVNNQLTLDDAARAEVLNRMRDNTFDLPTKLATYMTRMFTFGADIQDCGTVRPQVQIMTDIPSGDYLPHMFAGLILLLLGYKLILFLSVYYKINSRV